MVPQYIGNGLSGRAKSLAALDLPANLTPYLTPGEDVSTLYLTVRRVGFPQVSMIAQDRISMIPSPLNNLTQSGTNRSGKSCSSRVRDPAGLPQKVLGSTRRVTDPARAKLSWGYLRRTVLILWIVLVGGGLMMPSLPVLAQEITPDVPVYAEHVVTPGETLSEIAQTYDLTLAELMAANGISDADAVTIDQVLRIPASAAALPVTDSPQADPAAQLPISIHSLNRPYVVAEGDTVIRIADRFGLELSTLLHLNELDPEEASRLAIGQILVLPATPDELIVIPPSSHYTVQPGDTLGLIAEAHNLTQAQLQTANDIANPELLQVGHSLLIPGQTKPGTAFTLGLPVSGYDYHIVQPGETLSEIARDYATTVPALVSTNGLPDSESVYYGLYLRIPFGPAALGQRHPPVPHSGTSFLVSISRQQCWVFFGDRVMESWQCSTGHEEWTTRTGTFPIKTMMEMAQSSAYRLDMPFWLGLYDVNEFENGIHGLPIMWETGKKLWTSLIGQPATFGCAMLNDEDAARLFDLAYLGMPVHIVE